VGLKKDKMATKTNNKPNQKDYSFDLDKVFACMVSVQSNIPKDAFTAPVLGTERGGNGIVIKDGGIVLTIGYLVTEAETIWITDHTGTAVQGDVLGYDQESGLGLIQALGTLNAEVVPIGQSSSLKEADKVLVAGFGGQRNCISAEVIAIREFAGYWEYLLDDAIFTSPAHPNWGGAGLIGVNGELLGVGSLFIQHETVGDEVVDGNMVVPIDLLEPIIDDLLKMGRPNKKARPWLGLFGAEADGAIVVAALTEGGPAHDADVQVGDIVRAVAENEIDSLAELFRNIWSLGPAGIEVPLVLERDGDIIDVSILSVARSDMLKGPKLH
jgi:S1-C subfamily serine protease